MLAGVSVAAAAVSVVVDREAESLTSRAFLSPAPAWVAVAGVSVVAAVAGELIKGAWPM